LRELERKKEEDAKRLEEQEKKKELTRSIVNIKSGVEFETNAPGFVDPLTRKTPTVEVQSEVETTSEKPFVKEVDEQAILDAEMARMNRAIKKGGTIL